MNRMIYGANISAEGANPPDRNGIRWPREAPFSSGRREAIKFYLTRAAAAITSAAGAAPATSLQSTGLAAAAWVSVCVCSARELLVRK